MVEAPRTGFSHISRGNEKVRYLRYKHNTSNITGNVVLNTMLICIINAVFKF